MHRKWKPSASKDQQHQDPGDKQYYQLNLIKDGPSSSYSNTASFSNDVGAGNHYVPPEADASIKKQPEFYGSPPSTSADPRYQVVEPKKPKNYYAGLKTRPTTTVSYHVQAFAESGKQKGEHDVRNKIIKLINQLDLFTIRHNMDVFVFPRSQSNEMAPSEVFNFKASQRLNITNPRQAIQTPHHAHGAPATLHTSTPSQQQSTNLSPPLSRTTIPGAAPPTVASTTAQPSSSTQQQPTSSTLHLHMPPAQQQNNQVIDPADDLQNADLALLRMLAPERLQESIDLFLNRIQREENGGNPINLLSDMHEDDLETLYQFILPSITSQTFAVYLPSGIGSNELYDNMLANYIDGITTDIFFPNCFDHHFRMYRYHIATNELFFIDPFDNTDIFDLPHLPAIKNYLSKKFQVREPVVRPHDPFVRAFVQQRVDSINCGYFLLAFIEYLSKGLDPTLNDYGFDIYQYKRRCIQLFDYVINNRGATLDDLKQIPPLVVAQPPALAPQNSHASISSPAPISNVQTQQQIPPTQIASSSQLQQPSEQTPLSPLPSQWPADNDDDAAVDENADHDVLMVDQNAHAFPDENVVERKCYFEEKRLNSLEVKPRTVETTVLQGCSGNLISIGDLTKKDTRGVTEAEKILARGAAEFDIKLDNKEAKREIENRFICAATVAVAEVIDKFSENDFKIPGISQISDVIFDYETNSCVVRRHHGIGPGKVVKITNTLSKPKLQIVKETPYKPDTENFVFWREPGSLLKTNSKKTKAQNKNSSAPTAQTEDSEDESSNQIIEEPENYSFNPFKLYSCPTANCIKKFSNFGNFQNHCANGKHTFVPQRMTLYDTAINLFAAKLEHLEEERMEILGRQSVENFGSNDGKMMAKGWALNETAAKKRFPAEVHVFIEQQMAKYKQQGRKVDAKVVENLMETATNPETGRKLFAPSERLDSNQIASLVKRKIEKELKIARNQTNDPTDETMREEINDELENETGDIGIEFQDDPMFPDDMDVLNDHNFDDIVAEEEEHEQVKQPPTTKRTSRSDSSNSQRRGRKRKQQN